jgi:hypothetical protein
MLVEDPMVEKASAVEFFKEQVDTALAKRKVMAGELTAFYIVHMLASFLKCNPEKESNEPLGFRQVRAMDYAGSQRRHTLRSIGDESLFLTGFFSDSLNRKLVDVDYYVAIGSRAYDALSQFETDHLSPVFGELGEKFVGFMDVLSEIRERTSCTSDADILRLYEKWLKTGSLRTGQLLVELGVVPNATLKHRRVQ